MIIITHKIKEAWSGPGRKDGKITVFEPKFDALHIDMKKRGNSEWWYFDARLDNGYTVVGFFWAKHQRTGKTAVEIVIYKPNGEKIQNTYNYHRSDMKASREIAEVNIGKNYLKVDYSNEKFPQYEIFLDEGEFGIHLNYTAQVPGWMPGKGYTQFSNKGQFGWVVPLPRAHAEGTIKVYNETMKVKGVGYHDHNWLNFDLSRIVDYWYWGRLYSESFTLIYAYIQCSKKMDNHVINVLMLAKDENVILSTGEFDLIQKDFQYHERVENKYPKTLEFKLPNNNLITLEVQEIIDADNLLFELSPVIRFIAKNILKLRPGYFRFSSKFNLNFTHEGATYEEDGTTLHEMVIIK